MFLVLKEEEFSGEFLKIMKTEDYFSGLFLEITIFSVIQVIVSY